ncbi:MAG TPA: RagB/SusD family nutrient uptake outer membrane protein [Dinghuibacter sp.]|uniref:RagB/SusD family nutrient uptake outer membrane protein n=1 Tax=Dinghuibacter sp. TaxID=2024697 RepID=UPI002BAE5680|nr:RagB/SusD family nutrient uptake outer membrane protein [Dinghuibacter sp.]HTJ14819.1 RagB/SusD family nutrient uptake outer membrane protein [Dinghuibacter sp.]
MSNRIIFCVALGLIALSACKKNFLDRQPSDSLSNSSLFTDSSDVIAALNGCYSGWNNPISGLQGWADGYNVIYMDGASDNVYSQYPWEGFQSYGNGSATPGGVSPNGNGDNLYNYVTIQKCNWFLGNVTKAPISASLLARTQGEARFIRAYQYFMMSQLYGGVPLVTSSLTPSQADAVQRTTKDSVTQFVISELAAIAPSLPVSYSGGAGSETGRITRGAALALKARIELYNADYTNCIADCAQVMQLGYALYPSYTDLFREKFAHNSEVILDVEYIGNTSTSNTNWAVGVMPSFTYGGWSSLDPLQSLVDAYETTGGKTIDDPTSGYDPNNPFANRDPRLAASIVYPGEQYPYADGTPNYYDPLDASSSDFYQSGNNTSVTGYLEKKFTAVLADYNADNGIFSTGLSMILIRYAEVLLMDAEAKIEAGQIDASVYADINAVRQRAGMPVVDQSVYNSQSTLRTLVRRERRVELALEGLRWFDIQRWQIGPQVMSGPVTGARLGSVDPSTGVVTYTGGNIPVETRLFDASKNYLWPIPQSEIDINKQLKQNPGY